MSWFSIYYLFWNGKYLFTQSFNFTGIVHLENVFTCLWTSFIAFLGGKPATSMIDSKESYRSIVFVSLLSGSILWMFYKGILTAELSVFIKKYPFTDMDTFSETDWRYVGVLRAQSFTSLMAYSCQDINRVCSFSRFHNRIFACTLN